MFTGIGSFPEGERLVDVLHVILNVCQFVMGRDKVVHGHIGALLNSEVLAVTEIPGGGVTDNVTIIRLLQHGRVPEGVRHRIHAQ